MTEQTGAAPGPFDTSDLNLASFLRCRGFTIRALRHESGRAVFVFGDAPDLRHAVLDFANDGAIGVRSFCSALRDLRGITRRDAGELK